MDVVYHSNYLVWFETARIQMLDQIGMPYSRSKRVALPSRPYCQRGV